MRLSIGLEKAMPGKRITIVCERCGLKRFVLASVIKARGANYRFCSRKCYLASRRSPKVTIECAFCHKVVERNIYPYQFRIRTFFCSRQCSSASRYSLTSRRNDPEIARQWRNASAERNRERVNARNRAWGKANPLKRLNALHRRRAREKSGAIGNVDYASILKRDRMVCYLCKRKVKKKDLQFDHVIPVSKGGPHSQQNVAITHRWCNRSKSDSILTLF